MTDATTQPTSIVPAAFGGSIPIRPVMPRRSIFTLTSEEFQRMQFLAKMVCTSHFAYTKSGNTTLSEGDIFLIFAKGLEIGLELMAALDSIDLIQGKPTLDPAGMLALCNASGELEDIQFLEETDTVSKIMMKRRGQSAYTRTFTVEDAAKMITTIWENNVKKSAPITEKDNWKQQRAVMLKWRNVSAMCRVYFGDVVLGLYTAEELGADVNVDDSGHMTVISQPQQQQPTGAAQKAPPPAPEPPKMIIALDADGVSIEAPANTLGWNDPLARELAPANWERVTNKDDFPLWPASQTFLRDEAGKARLRELLNGLGAVSGSTSAPFLEALEIKAFGDFIGTEKQLEERLRAYAKPAQPKNAPPPAPAAPGIIPFTDDSEIALNQRIWFGFDRSPDEVMQALGTTNWTDKYPDVGAAWNAIIALAYEQRWPVVAETVVYTLKGSQKYLDFKTPVPVRLYGGREALTKLAGEDYAVDNGIASWVTQATPYDINPLKLEWKPEKGYNVVIRAEPVMGEEDDIDSQVDNILDEHFGKRS